MTSKKILIAGAFSSGKSTLIDDLSSRDRRFLAAPEGPRRILAHCPNKLLGTQEVRAYLIVNQLLVEHELSSAEEHVLFEGGLINNIAHDIVFLAPAPDRTVLIESMGHVRYDIAFVCNYPEIPLEDDGQRFDDDDLRQKLDLAVRETLVSMNYEPIELNGSREERVARVLELL